MFRRRAFVLTSLLLACVMLGAAHTHGDDHEHYHSDILKPREAKTRYGCDYDAFESRRSNLRRVVDQRDDFLLSQKRNTASSFSQPLRILVLANNLVNDPGSCYSVGQSIPLDTGGSYTCTAADILTSDKATFLNTTLIPYAVNRFYQMLYVNRTYTRLTVAPSTDSQCDSYVPLNVPS